MADPDYIYDPDNWEVTYEWGIRDLLAEGLDLWEMKRFATLIEGPPKWCVRIGIDLDEEGEPGDYENQWFDSQEEAETALAKARGEV